MSPDVLWELLDLGDRASLARIERYIVPRAVLVMDLVGFTKRTDEEGVISALSYLRDCQRRAVGIIEDCGGVVVKCAADNVFAVFGLVGAAQAAAAELVRAFPCSCGIGYGPTLVLFGDLYGAEVNHAAKLGEDVAGPGEVLLTEAARAA